MIASDEKVKSKKQSQKPIRKAQKKTVTRPAVAGTLESSDCQVMIEEGDGKVEFSLESSVINQYGNQIRKVALETLENLGVNNAKVKIVDKGALDCTIKARIEAAVYRSVL